MQRPIKATYTLKYPLVPAQGEPVTDVIVVRSRGKDRRVIDRHYVNGVLAAPMALQLEMIERLVRRSDGSDIYPGFAEELDEEDVDALGELVMPASDDGPPTG